MTFPPQKTSILVISNNSEQNYTVHQCLSVLHETFERMLVSPKGYPHSKSSYFVFVFKNNFDQKWFILENLLCYFTSINSWWFDICLLIWKLDVLHRESKKLLLNDSDQSIIAWAAPPFMCSSGGIMSHCALPDVLTWKSGGHVSEQFDIQGSQFSAFVDSFSLIAHEQYCKHYIWRYLRFGQICLSLSATTFHFPLWKDLVLTTFYPSFKTFLRLPSSI